MLDEYAKSSRQEPRPLRGSGKLKVELVSSLEALKPYADAWNCLAYEAPHKLPTLSYAWVISFLEYFLAPGESWCCAMAYDGAVLIGLLPVVITPHNFMGLSRPRIQTPFNQHSFSVDFLCQQGRESEVMPALLTAVMEKYPTLYEISLHRLPGISPSLGALKNNWKDGATVVEFDGMGSYLQIGLDINEFRSRLSHNFSRNLIKAKNKLGRLKDVKIEFLSHGEIQGDEIERFIKIEASGWKKTAGTAIMLSPVLSSYYAALLSRMRELGWLEWHFLEADGKTIAGQMAIRMGRNLIILKIAYDEEYSFCSPGNILFEKTVERAYADKDIDIIDCITDMPWHDNWAMGKRPYYNLWIYPHHPLPTIFGMLGKRTKITIKDTPILSGAFNWLKLHLKGGKP